MALLQCTISNGLRAAEVTVEIQNHTGQSQFLPINRDFVVTEGKKQWLPVSIVRVDQEKDLVVVGLPVETDSGAHRIVVRWDQLKQEKEALT